MNIMSNSFIMINHLFFQIFFLTFRTFQIHSHCNQFIFHRHGISLINTIFIAHRRIQMKLQVYAHMRNFHQFNDARFQMLIHSISTRTSINPDIKSPIQIGRLIYFATLQRDELSESPSVDSRTRIGQIYQFVFWMRYGFIRILAVISSQNQISKSKQFYKIAK